MFVTEYEFYPILILRVKINRARPTGRTAERWRHYENLSLNVSVAHWRHMGNQR